jgi:hypothetical protein
LALLGASAGSGISLSFFYLYKIPSCFSQTCDAFLTIFSVVCNLSGSSQQSPAFPLSIFSFLLAMHHDIRLTLRCLAVRRAPASPLLSVIFSDAERKEAFIPRSRRAIRSPFPQTTTHPSFPSIQPRASSSLHDEVLRLSPSPRCRLFDRRFCPPVDHEERKVSEPHRFG